MTAARGNAPARRSLAWLLPAALAAGLLAGTPVLAQQHRSHQVHQRGHHQVHRQHVQRHDHGRPRVHFGVVIGAPVFPIWHAPAPRYYYPAPVVVQAAPPVYIERDPPVAAPAESTYWYFCRESNTYYPYVSTCAGEWQRVTPQPPPG